MNTTKKLHKLAVCLTAAAVAMTALPAGIVTAEGTAAQQPLAKSIVILGDSISSGYALKEGEFGYYDYLADTLGGTVTNLAVPGHETADLINVLAQEDAQKAISGADLICLSIGGNDLLHPLMDYFADQQLEGESVMDTISRLAKTANVEKMLNDITTLLKAPINQAKENFILIDETLHNLNSTAPVAFQTVYNPAELKNVNVGGVNYASQLTQMNNYIYGQLGRLNKGIKALTYSTPVDVLTAFRDTGWIYVRTMEKDVHPTALGHGLIAALTLDTIYTTPDLGCAKFADLLLNGMSAEDKADCPADDYALIERYAIKRGIPSTSSVVTTTTTPVITTTTVTTTTLVATTTTVTTTTPVVTATTISTTTTPAVTATTVSTTTAPVVTTTTIPTTTTTPAHTVSEKEFGDIDGNGEIQPVDALLALKAAAAIMSFMQPELTEKQMQLADVNGDGTVTVLDAQYILMYSSMTSAQIETTWRELTKNPLAPDFSNLA